MIDRPYAFAVMFGVGAIMLLFGGMLLTDAQTAGVTDTTTFFDNVTDYYSNANTGLKAVSDETAESLSEGDEAEQTEQSFLVRAGRGLLKLGGSFKVWEGAASDAAGEIGIPDVFIGIIMAVLLIIFGVVLYTWWRGK